MIQPYNYYPNAYGTGMNTYNPYQPQMPQFQQAAQTMPATAQPAPQQIQNGGFISVPSETVARNYPVAPGNSITFKDENLPYVYTKTMGFSQLDRPVFERFRLVKEEETPAQNSVQGAEIMPNQQSDNNVVELIKGDISALQAAYGQLKNEVEILKSSFSTNEEEKPTAKLMRKDDDK